MMQFSIHTIGTVQSWFEEFEGELHHLPWPDLNITDPLWSVLETRVGNRFPPQTSLKYLKMFFKKNGIKFCQRLFKTCTSPFQDGLWLYWRQMVVQPHINKEMCTVSVAFPLFCPTPNSLMQGETLLIF
jgi:hypothetical protein